MNKSKICYRKLKIYKYQMMEDYIVDTDIITEKDIETSFIALTKTGKLTIKSKYAWDGASGPTFDTKSFMRSSLVHDALYQLMRELHLDYKKYRGLADNLLKKMCVEDGMLKLRAWYVHIALCLFGTKHARPSKKLKIKLIYAP